MEHKIKPSERRNKMKDLTRAEKLKLLEIEHKRVGERIKAIKDYDPTKTPYKPDPLSNYENSRDWAALKRATLDFNRVAVEIRKGG